MARFDLFGGFHRFDHRDALKLAVHKEADAEGEQEGQEQGKQIAAGHDDAAEHNHIDLRRTGDKGMEDLAQAHAHQRTSWSPIFTK